MDIDKLKWLCSIGAHKFKEPMSYSVRTVNGESAFYSEKYLDETPLEILMQRFDMINRRNSNGTIRSKQRKTYNE